MSVYPIRWVVPLLLCGCQCGSAPEEVLDDCQKELALPSSVATDILFVIDNSGSMAEEQGKMMDKLHTFISTIGNAPIKNDFQIGVITTGIEQRALFCNGTQDEKQFPEESGRLQGTKELRKILRRSDSDLLEQFQQLVTQGTKGSGQEMGLEAVRLALGDLLKKPLEEGGNQGFLRPGSRLLVVILSDEDDCSDPKDLVRIRQGCPSDPLCTSDATCAEEGFACVLSFAERRCQENGCETAQGRAQLEPVTTYVEFFRGLDDGTGRGRKREVFVAVIGAVSTATGAPERCRQGANEAYGVAKRYRALVDALHPNSLIDSICNEAYEKTLIAIAELVNAPQTIDLQKAPPDPHLLQIEIQRGSQRLECRVDQGFTFEAATEVAPARITMQEPCRLRSEDRLELKLACAG